MKTLKAVLSSGQIIEYLPDIIGEGGMKRVYFTPDRKAVVCFFKDRSAGKDPQRQRRLDAILGEHNPTTDPQTGAYWKKLFCWPTHLVTQPEFGIVAPTYPSHFFFSSGTLQGKEKDGRWFTGLKARKLVPASERGTWLNYIQVCICMARGVSRLHLAGLAHSDLSNRNVLVDPSSGSAIIIDIDALVVPGVYPPDVIGTAGYIAPEVVATQHLPLDNPLRVLPSIRTDLHALPVLIYENLLLRHPLRGPKIHSMDVTQDEQLSMGQRALFIENPGDASNRPPKMTVPYTALGPYLAPLMEQAFIAGLHHPNDRPTAGEWEKALVRTLDLLLPCQNSSCEAKWFVFSGSISPRCPFCGWTFRGTMPVLNLYRERRAGQFVSDNHRLVVWQNQWLYPWHVFDNCFPGPTTDKTPLAYFTYLHGKWLLVNEACDSLSVIGSGPVLPKQYIELQEGTQIRLSTRPHGRLAVVQMVKS